MFSETHLSPYANYTFLLFFLILVKIILSYLQSSH